MRSIDLEVAGAFGKVLASRKAPPSPAVFNGTLPISITFGPANGCGAGWYDETGATHRVGVGSLASSARDTSFCIGYIAIHCDTLRYIAIQRYNAIHRI